MYRTPNQVVGPVTIDPAGGFAALLKVEVPRLHRYAARLTGSGADADDLLQDTMLRCWAARASFRPGSSLAAWSRTIMRNGFLSGRRRHRHLVDLSDDAIDQLCGVAEQQSNVVHLSDARAALGKLSSAHRAAVLLIIEGVSYEEGAARLQIPVGTLKNRVVRGRRQLRQLVDGGDASAMPGGTTAATPLPTAAGPVGPLAGQRRCWSGVTVG